MKALGRIILETALVIAIFVGVYWAITTGQGLILNIISG